MPLKSSPVDDSSSHDSAGNFGGDGDGNTLNESAARTKPIRVAVLGNPNTGKSTLFNALTGLNVRTGNYAGVTVERRTGRTHIDGRPIEIIDLPGVYSLSPQAKDEMVAVEVVLGMLKNESAPDVLLCIASAEHLERHLFLVSQALDLGLPTVVAINMWDSAVARGIEIDAPGLAQSLGVPVIATQAHRRKGVDDVRQALVDAAMSEPPKPLRPLPPAFTEAAEVLRQSLADQGCELPAFYVQRALLQAGGLVEQSIVSQSTDETLTRLEQGRQALQAQGLSVDSLESRARFEWIRQHCLPHINMPHGRQTTLTDKLDRVLTHRVLGFGVFLAVMFLVFQIIFHWATPMMDLMEGVQTAATTLTESLLPSGAFRSMLTDSVIGGAGTVLIFIPQIALLFLLIAILEDCGYMPRVAFMMDRVMSSVGLNGKSFIPLMSSFACAIPGIMGARVIENPRDRLITILVAPLMSCSARLPVYLLLIGAFIPATSYLGGVVSLQGLVLFGMSSIGAAIAIPMAFLFRRTVLPGEHTPFVLELPEYKIPSLTVVLNRMVDRVKAFIIRAGTLILAASVLIWAAGYFPGDRTELRSIEQELAIVEGELAALSESATSDEDESRRSELDTRHDQLVTALNLESSELLEESYLGRCGKLIEPAVRPLGWDWRIGIGALASFPAREVIISTLGTIYSLGGDVDEEDEGLVSTMKQSTWPDGRPVYNIPVALSIMVFFALCAQCVSTLLVMRRETNSWKWPIVCFVYMTTLAYVGALLTYQIGSRLGA